MSDIKMISIPKAQFDRLEKENAELKGEEVRIEVKIPSEVLDYINETPELSSILYDADMLPEQLKSNGAKWGLRGCYMVYKYMKAKEGKGDE